MKKTTEDIDKVFDGSENYKKLDDKTKKKLKELGIPDWVKQNKWKTELYIGHIILKDENIKNGNWDKFQHKSTLEEMVMEIVNGWIKNGQKTEILKDYVTVTNSSPKIIEPILKYFGYKDSTKDEVSKKQLHQYFLYGDTENDFKNGIWYKYSNEKDKPNQGDVDKFISKHLSTTSKSKNAPEDTQSTSTPKKKKKTEGPSPSKAVVDESGSINFIFNGKTYAKEFSLSQAALANIHYQIYNLDTPLTLESIEKQIRMVKKREKKGPLLNIKIDSKTKSENDDIELKREENNPNALVIVIKENTKLAEEFEQTINYDEEQQLDVENMVKDVDEEKSKIESITCYQLVDHKAKLVECLPHPFNTLGLNLNTLDKVKRAINGLDSNYKYLALKKSIEDQESISDKQLKTLLEKKKQRYNFACLVEYVSFEKDSKSIDNDNDSDSEEDEELYPKQKLHGEKLFKVIQEVYQLENKKLSDFQDIDYCYLVN